MKLPGVFCNRWRAAGLVLGAVALVWLAATATFLFDHTQTRFVAHLANDFGLRHNCLTSYVVASYLADERADNIYDPYRYRNAKVKTPVHEVVDGVLAVDGYHYPPTFLPFPYLIARISGDFFAVRRVWFVLTVLSMLAAMIALAAWCGVTRDNPALYLMPLLLCAPTLHVALAMGNAHVLVVSAAVLAMVLLETRRTVLGSLLLAAVCAAKVWPVVLLVHLAMRRKWSAIIWSTVFIAGSVAMTLLLFGTGPFRSFIEFEMPRVASGDAFMFMKSSLMPLTVNLSITGIPHKLHALELFSSDPPLVNRAIAAAYVLLVLAVITWVSWNCRNADDSDASRLERARLWLASIVLAQLASPFLPWQYGTIAAQWLVLLLIPSVRGWKMVALLVVWLGLAVNFPFALSLESMKFHFIYALVAQLAIGLVVGLSLIRQGESVGALEVKR